MYDQVWSHKFYVLLRKIIMYLAPQATFRPHQRWHWLILGWFIPALIALPWLAGPLWMTPSRSVALNRLFELPSFHTQDFAPLRIVFLIFMGFNALLYLRFIKPSSKGMVGLLIGIGITYIVYQGCMLVRANYQFWAISINDLDKYSIRVGHLLAGIGIGCVLTSVRLTVTGFSWKQIPSIILGWIASTVCGITLYTLMFGVIIQGF